MKISKITLVSGFIIFLTILIFIGRTAYNIGQHNASLAIKQATPKQLAEAMQEDNFYGEYIKTMLLVTGKIKKVTKFGQETIVFFETTQSPSVLGNVSCDLGNTQNAVKQGDTINILTVAYDAERKNRADVFMPNCYLLK